MAEDYANRLRKNLKKLEKWARQEGIECYRLYDADLPEYNVAVDRYGDWAVIQEYAPPKTVDAQKRGNVCSILLRQLCQCSVFRRINWC